MSERRTLINRGIEGIHPEIGRALWQLEDARRRTLRWLETMPAEAVDWQYGEFNSVGTLLYHIAAIELDWLYADVLARDWTPAINVLFPHDVRDANGRLHPVTGVPLSEHLHRLEQTRHWLLEAYSSMSLEDYRQPRITSDYDVTPEWVLHHLAQHEAEHRGEMMTVVTLWTSLREV